jgi:hypothetical protein
VERVKTRSLFAAVIAAAVVLPAQASGAIVVQKGIGGVALGMSKTKVRANLGTPTRTRTGKNEFGIYTVFVYPRVRVTFQGGAAATAVETTSKHERTGSGVGVGSKTATVKTRIAGVKCEFSAAGAGHCYLGKFDPGRRVTDFFILKGHVTRVVIGFVID